MRAFLSIGLVAALVGVGLYSAMADEKPADPQIMKIPREAAQSNDSPTKLDLEKLSVRKIKETADVADAADELRRYEGYVTPVGSFRVGDGRSEAMILVAGAFPHADYFQHSGMGYVDEYTDPKTLTSGSLYSILLDGKEKVKRVIYVLLGNKDLGSGGGITLRRAIIYNSDGSHILSLTASYAKSYK